MSRFTRLLRRLLAGLAAGVVAGLVCGGAARVLMRVVTLLIDQEAELTLAGTTLIVLFFVIAVVPGTVLAAVYRGRGRAVPLVIMCLLLWIPATNIARGDLADVGDLSAVQWCGAACAIVGIYALIAAMPLLALRLLRAWSSEDQSSRTRPRSDLVSPR